MKHNSIQASRATIVPDESSSDEKKGSGTDKFAQLSDWVVEKVEAWRTHRDSNYLAEWDQFERLWRGKWDSAEQLRQSERSKIVTPALSEAVENAAAEIEEATFGRGSDYFDVEADEKLKQPEPDPATAPFAAQTGQPAPVPGPMDQAGQPPMGMQQPLPGMLPAPAPMADTAEQISIIRQSLREDLQRSDFAANVCEVVLHAAVFGTGFGEVVTMERVIKTQTPDGLSSDDVTRSIPTLRAVSPRNLVVDPNAKRIEEAMGAAIEEHVSKHLVVRAQADGTFRSKDEIDACTGSMEDDAIDGDQVGNKATYAEDKVHMIRYYGLVPKKLLYPEDSEKNEGGKIEGYEDGDYVEAIVVITNKSNVVKAESTPAPMGDRPIVCFPWDIIPGRLYGRGICEKGANSQKILDAEVRARLDSLALTTVPMMGMDATKIPRGAKFKITPGGTFLTNGDPETVLRPLKFGMLDPNHWQNAASLQAMVHQATGSIDATKLAGSIGDARSGAVSMAMAPVIKRYKRTMVRFFDLFLMPTLEKIVSRAKQSMPDRYPSVAVRLRPASTMGIMQREYETSQLTALLQSLPPQTPEHRVVLMGIVGNTSIPNREQLLKMIAGAEQREAAVAQQAMAAQADPMAQQLQQVTMELGIAKAQAEIAKLQSEAFLNQVKAEETRQMSEVKALEVATKGMYAVPAEQQRDEWDRRVKMAELVLQDKAIGEKAADRESNERIATNQMSQSALQHDKVRKLEEKLSQAEQEIEITRDEQGRVSGARPKKKKAE